MPYITIHAQRKSRAIWRLVNSLDLHENLFLDVAAAENSGAENDGSENGAGGENGGAESGGLDGKEKGVRSAKEEDDDIVDSDDEMDDEGEEFDVNLTGGDGGEGNNGGNTSLVCISFVVECKYFI